jgi:hypothetical protein
MTWGELTIACDRQVVVGGDMAVHAERHTDPLADTWVLCISTDRRRVRIGAITPHALACGLDDDGALRLRFPAAVRAIDLSMDVDDVADVEWRFWVDDSAWDWAAPPARA